MENENLLMQQRTCKGCQKTKYAFEMCYSKKSPSLWCKACRSKKNIAEARKMDYGAPDLPFKKARCLIRKVDYRDDY